MDLLTTFPMAMSGLTFLILSKDKKSKKYRVAGIMMLLASFISVVLDDIY
ncbi:hypothetical protein [Leuconostoc mesenteroides]|nr:hypothetical protein [Leuconostoc mesenteroides]MBZ1515558.1 hypothetical protein [Leuconostoc mesenteroides]